MSKIARLENHPDYNPWFDSHPEIKSIYDSTLYMEKGFQTRIDKLNALYKEIGFPFFVTYTNCKRGWRGSLYQLEFTRTSPIPDGFQEIDMYLPKGVQSLDKIAIVRYLEHAYLYAQYVYQFLDTKYRKSLPFAPKDNDDMPF